MTRIRISFLAGLLLVPCPVWAGAWHIPHHHRDGTPEPGRPRALPHTDERAGCPRCLAHRTDYSNTHGGIGYFVGGGAAFGHGDSRCPNEGTWGWDETGFPHFRRRGTLGWWHGRKEQGGTGAYKTDGVKVPDPIFTINNATDNLHR